MPVSLASWPPVLYVIADLSQGGESGQQAARVAGAIRKEATPAELTLLFQLRDRNTSARALFDAASSWIKTLLPWQAFVLINERTDIAIATGAAGVHLGTGSYPAEAARELLPEGLVALSAHTPEELRQARQWGCDFVTLSPVFHSPGKGTPIGTESLRSAAELAPGIPLLALGGVTPENLQQVSSTGASGAAVIGAVWNSADPAHAAGRVAAAMKTQWKLPHAKGD